YGGRILLNLEVPDSQHSPPRIRERRVLSGVARDVALDLGVPVALPAIRLPFARVTVPERTIDKDSEFPARERYVDASARTAPVTAPASHPCFPQRAPQ